MDAESRRMLAEGAQTLAKRCRLTLQEYEQRVLMPAIRAAEKKAGFDDDIPELDRRAMRAARSAGARTAKGVKRWMENATWRWRCKAQREETTRRNGTRRAAANRIRDAVVESEQAETETRGTAEADRERKALDLAAEQREATRLAGIERRRMHARRAVLGAQAAALAEEGADAGAAWAGPRWESLQKWSQEACWTVLRPLLGLEAATFGELIRRKHRAAAETAAGRRPHADQEVLRRRKQWRDARMKAWTRIGERVRRNAEHGNDTARNTIVAAIVPRGPMP